MSIYSKNKVVCTLTSWLLGQPPSLAKKQSSCYLKPLPLKECQKLPCCSTTCNNFGTILFTGALFFSCFFNHFGSRPVWFIPSSSKRHISKAQRKIMALRSAETSCLSANKKSRKKTKRNSYRFSSFQHILHEKNWGIKSCIHVETSHPTEKIVNSQPIPCSVHLTVPEKFVWLIAAMRNDPIAN